MERQHNTQLAVLNHSLIGQAFFFLETIPTAYSRLSSLYLTTCDRRPWVDWERGGQRGAGDWTRYGLAPYSVSMW